MDAVVIAVFTGVVFVSLLTVGLLDMRQGNDSQIGSKLRGDQVEASEELVSEEGDEGARVDPETGEVIGSNDSDSRSHDDEVAVPLGDDGQVSDDPDDPVSSPDSDDETDSDGGGDDTGSGGDGDGDGSTGGPDSGGDTGSPSGEQPLDGGKPKHVSYRWSNSTGEYSLEVSANGDSADVYAPQGLRTISIRRWNPDDDLDDLCDETVEDGGGHLGAGPPEDGRLAVAMSCSNSDGLYVAEGASLSGGLSEVWESACDTLGRRACDLSD